MRTMTASLLFVLSLTLGGATVARAEGVSDLRLEWSTEQPAGDPANRNPRPQPNAQKLRQQLPFLPQFNRTPHALNSTLHLAQTTWTVDRLNSLPTGLGIAYGITPAFLCEEPTERGENNGHATTGMLLRLTAPPLQWESSINSLRLPEQRRLLLARDGISAFMSSATQTNRLEGGQR